MDAKELVKKLAQHPLVKSDMPLQVQLGLPYLENRGGKLCISFKPHRELCVDGKLAFYPQQYEIAWAYPFEKVIYFSNLSYTIESDKEVDASKPVACVSLDRMAGGGKYLLEELYSECTRVLTFREQEGKVSDVMLRKYQRFYYETARQLGLSALYGEML